MDIEKILNKRSNDVVTDGGIESPKKPTSSQLDNGEIAVNYHKGTERLFMKNDNEEVVDFIPKNEVEANYYDKDDTDTLLAGKVDKIEGKGLSTNDYTTAEKTKLSDLPTASELTTALAGKQNTINDLATIRSGAQAGATAVQPSDLTPIDDRLDDVEYCLGDYLKETYVFNWENHTTTTTEPIYTTIPLWTVDGNHSFRTFSCRLTAGSATISALYLGKMDSTDGMYFTQAGTVTMYLALYSRPSTTDNLIRVYDASGNTVKIISTYEVPYSSQHVCTPFTFEVEPGYYLKIVTKVPDVAELIWLGQIDFEIAGVKQIDKDVHANSAAIEAIEQMIPAQTSSSNKLVDKDSLAPVATTGSYNDLSDKPDLSSFITNSVDDLVNYYLKSETYTKTEVDNKIGDIETLLATI